MLPAPPSSNPITSDVLLPVRVWPQSGTRLRRKRERKEDIKEERSEPCEGKLKRDANGDKPLNGFPECWSASPVQDTERACGLSCPVIQLALFFYGRTGHPRRAVLAFCSNTATFRDITSVSTRSKGTSFDTFLDTSCCVHISKSVRLHSPPVSHPSALSCSCGTRQSLLSAPRTPSLSLNFCGISPKVLVTPNLSNIVMFVEVW